jgi:thiol:disulfide interchange protein DsbD
MLLLTYSFGFALPYVFLGASAAKVSRIKVHHRIQVGVKLVFASVMFALGLYYLRIPAYELLQQVKPWWKTIAFWTSLAGTGLLVTWIALPRLHNNKLSTILPGITLALGIFATTQALTTGPVSTLKWYKVEEEAWAAAKVENKPILVDAWAEWCEACKKMDVTTFVDPEVVSVLEKDWILLKLDLTESNDVNDALQEKYGLQSLPTLTLLPPVADLNRKVHITGYASAGTLLARLREWQESHGKVP